MGLPFDFKSEMIQVFYSNKQTNKTILQFNCSTDALLEVALTITAKDSNRPHFHLPHTLEPRVDERIFGAQSTVQGCSSALRIACDVL